MQRGEENIQAADRDRGVQQLEPVREIPWTGPDRTLHTVLIHRLDVGSSGQQLLDRLLQAATGRQVERTEQDTREGGSFCFSLNSVSVSTVTTQVTHVCSAAFVALMSAVPDSFSRINSAHSSFPCQDIIVYTRSL